MKIIFTNKAKPVSDFDVERTYEEIKNFETVEISNILLLQRLRLGIINEEIKPSSLTIIEDEKELLSTTIDSNGSVMCWDADVLNLESKFISLIWKKIREKN